MNDQGIQATIVFEANWDAIHQMSYLPDGTPDLDKAGNHRRKYRYIINVGSSRSSKTISIIDAFDLYAWSYDNKRLTVWRSTKSDCKKTVLNDVLKRLKATGRYKVDQEFHKTESIFTYSNDSTFEIHGTDDALTVHGLTQDAAWFNEPYDISKDTFDQIDQRTADFIMLDLNPRKGHWSDDLMKDPRTLVINSTFRDNPFCPEESRRKILTYQPLNMCAVYYHYLEQTPDKDTGLALKLTTEYDELLNLDEFTLQQIKEFVRCRENVRKGSASEYNWSVYGLGQKAERPNRIYHWTKIPRYDYDQIEATKYYGNDWGKVDPWAIAEYKYYDGALYIRELNYRSENEIRDLLPVSELTQINQEDKSVDVDAVGSVGIVSWMYNRQTISKEAVILCDSNRPGKIAWLRRCGWVNATPASKIPGSIIDGIELLEDLRVYYTDDSPNVEFEQENYSYKVDRHGIVLEEPEDKNNHHMDGARYVAQYLRAIGVIRVK